MKLVSGNKLKSIFRNDEDFYLNYRLKNLKELEKTPAPGFKYGLSINISPGFDFSSLQPQKAYPRITTKYPSNEGIIVKFDNKCSLDTFQRLNNNRRREYFNLLHDAYANNFITIIIPDNKELEEPIFMDIDALDVSTYSTIQIHAGNNSHAKILIHKTQSSEKQIFCSDNITITTGNNSNVSLITIQDLYRKSINIQNRIATTGKDSKVELIDLLIGSQFTKTSAVADLKHEGSDARNTVLFFAKDNQKFDIYTASVHSSKNTFSDIVTKGAVTGKSVALSRGLVKISPNASGSNGYEKQDVLILSEESEADAIPNLEIENHDVKCSHGSTIGQIDKEMLFYLMSRGLNEDIAKQKIIEGYFSPVLEQFSADVKEQIYESIIKALK